MTVRAKAVVRRIDAANAVEAQEVTDVIERRSRPKVAAVADTVQTAVAEAARTRSRVPDGRCTAEHTGEVHTLVGAVI